MSQTMIERVAIVILKGRYPGANITFLSSYPSVLRDARAAIEAMREPTEGMMMAGGRQVADIVGDPYASSHWMHFSNEVKRVHGAMIDAALMGPKP